MRGDLLGMVNASGGGDRDRGVAEQSQFSVGLLGFVGIGNTSNFVANEGLLRFEREFCVQQRGDGDEATRGHGEPKTRFHEAKGCSHFDASTPELGERLELAAKYVMSNELGIIVWA